jgi:hypothetical protein
VESGTDRDERWVGGGESDDAYVDIRAGPTAGIFPDQYGTAEIGIYTRYGFYTRM